MERGQNKVRQEHQVVRSLGADLNIDIQEEDLSFSLQTLLGIPSPQQKVSQSKKMLDKSKKDVIIQLV
jgi:hypothetical protein